MKNQFLILSRRTALVLLSCLFVGVASAKTIYVDGWNTSPGDGSTWATAYNDLEAALVASVSGDEVWVAGGEANQSGEVIPIEYSAPAGKAFSWKSGVNIYGGFAPNATSKETRDLSKNPSALVASGERLFYPGNFTKDCYVDGFTLTGAVKETNNGGLAYLRDGAHIVNCIITGATSTGNGTINLDGKNGALIPTVENCVIYGNSAKIGGGVYINSMGIVKNCLIYNNKAATSSGGGVAGNGGAVPCRVINCVIANNEASNNGGGVWGTGIEIINCTIVRNKALNTNAANDGQGNGGGVLLDISKGGVPSELINCVVWGNNTAKNEADAQFAGRKDIWHGAGDLERGKISYSAIENIATANSGIVQVPSDAHCVNLSNTNAEAKFIAPTATIGVLGDYSAVDWNISNGSILVNAGNNSANEEPKDMKGNARIQSGLIDLGAYESSFASSISETLSDKAKGKCFIVGNQLIVTGEPGDVEVYSVTGLLMKSALQTNGMSVSDLNAGIYVVMVKSGDHIFTQKVSKE